MIRYRTNPSAAMELSGHKRRRVFDRYNIVNDADRAGASELLQSHLGAQPNRSKIGPITAHAWADGAKGSL